MLQEKADEVELFLKEIPTNHLFISDFTLHSIGVIMTKLKKNEEFRDFLDDLFVEAKLQILSLTHLDLKEIIDIIEKKKLDFDDAYQVVVSKKLILSLVTFDKDF